MNINIDNLEIKRAVLEILDVFKWTLDNDITLDIIKGEMLCVSLYGKTGKIEYKNKVEIFRGLGIFFENFENGNFRKNEKNKFETVGTMIDMSRNGVMTVESLKMYIRYMAVMGLNRLMLYTEDIYTIPEREYFGYMRGRYSQEEIIAIDNYADMFGIELVPCIQTLGHMEQYLKWAEAAPAKDTDAVLLSGAEETYVLIEEMIRAASAPVRSKNIHIGMDEAWDVGLGKYLATNGYKRGFDILSSHLTKVIAITEKYGLKPMIWSDMYFRLGSKTADYYDLDCNIPQEIIQQIPDVSLVYWDYYHDDYEFYDSYIKKHNDLKKNTVFAGHVWTWAGFLPNYDETEKRFRPALRACCDNQVKDVFATLWGDNGCETNYFLALLGLQMYAEYAYSKEEPSADTIAKRFEFVTGANYSAFMDFTAFHYISYETRQAFMGKKYLFQDILMGLADFELYEEPISGHYDNMAKKYQEYMQKNEKWSYYYEYAYHLFDTVAHKCAIAENLKIMYANKDKEYLQLCVKELLPQLSKKVDDLRKIHREQWHATFKPFGWEVLDIRYSGIIGRIDSAIYRLEAYLEGEIPVLEELEEKRLKYLKNHMKNQLYACEVTASSNF